MKKLFTLALSVFALVSCQMAQIESETLEKMEVSLALGVTTKVSDNTFDSGDKVGIYMVNQPSSLLSSGNHYDNIQHSYDGSNWTPSEQMYWLDKTTEAVFYGYYPYSEVSDVNEHSFTVATDQSELSSLKSSDFVWGKSASTAPSKNPVALQTSHIMSSIKIYVEPGDGFKPETFADLDVKVNLRNVKNSAKVNLEDGSVTAVGSSVQMTPYKDNGYYRAIIVPQTVADESELVVITVNGTEYTLKKGFAFASGTRHKFTVKVNKTGSGVNIGIGGWEEDEEDNGGNAE